MDPHALTQLLGYAAATLTTLSFVPQAVHTFRSGEVAGVSVGMYSAFTAGVAMWLLYGLALGEWPIVIANAITLALAAGILGMTVRARRRAKRQAAEIRMDC
jgi:MtN3 and saliva related transmembrane protein